MRNVGDQADKWHVNTVADLTMGTSGLEEDGCRCSCCCCGEEESLCRQQTLIELLRHKETQMQRLVRFLVAGGLLLVSVLLVVVLMCVVGRSARSSDCQVGTHLSSLQLPAQLPL